MLSVLAKGLKQLHTPQHDQRLLWKHDTQLRECNNSAVRTHARTSGRMCRWDNKQDSSLRTERPQCSVIIERTTCLGKPTGLLEGEDAKHVSKERISDQFLKQKRRA